MEFGTYDYKARKAKIEEILDNTDAVQEVDKFPVDEKFTYSNGYKAWASAIFVDLRDSTKWFTEKEDLEIAKVIRGFTSEIIEILRKDTDKTDLKEIGIRGDCVFAVYSTPTKDNIYDVAKRAFYINTYLKMLNAMLESRNLPKIKAGIGLATSKTLAVKAGRHSSGINNLVWIGKSVATAAKLSDLGNKNNVGAIVMDNVFHDNHLKAPKNTNSEKAKKENWWTRKNDETYGVYHHGDIIIQNFNDWINDGMPTDEE